MWFFRSPDIVFGEGALDYLTQIKGNRALIVTDQNIVALGFVEKVQAKLAEAGIEAAVFDEVEPEPSLQTARRVAQMAQTQEPDLIIALGGGSCIDAAKGGWFLYERPDLDLDGLNPFEDLGMGEKGRMIAIPTTSGTGSEVTIASVLTDKEENRKVALGSGEIVPDIAIVDPVFVMNLPPRITADTGLDALTHAVEGFTCTWYNDFSDGLCLKAIGTVFEYLPRAYELGAQDPEAREKLHNAATIAGLGFGNAFAALAHAMGHSLGAVFGTPHGRAVGLFLPYTIEYTANRGGSRYAEIARYLGLPGVDEPTGATSLVAAILQLYQRLDQPTSIRALGIDEKAFTEALPLLIDNAETDTQIVSSCCIPDSEELERMFLYAYEGKPIDF
ncbi:MAG: iron-containing alcohol dehydrogenase [Anaerolineae bacterium]|jgi:alcohol dehydrogenase class IV